MSREQLIDALARAGRRPSAQRRSGCSRFTASANYRRATCSAASDWRVPAATHSVYVTSSNRRLISVPYCHRTPYAASACHSARSGRRRPHPEGRSGGAPRDTNAHPRSSRGGFASHCRTSSAGTAPHRWLDRAWLGRPGDSARHPRRSVHGARCAVEDVDHSPTWSLPSLCSPPPPRIPGVRIGYGGPVLAWGYLAHEGVILLEAAARAGAAQSGGNGTGQPGR